MKKTYSKPRIIIEDFTLSQNIANCGAVHNSELGKPTHWTKTTCGWDFGGVSLWTASPACDIPTGEQAEGSELCYNAPEGGYSVFSS